MSCAESRFGPGLPRVSDGSSLFTGGAGSGESEIRRDLLQNDMVEVQMIEGLSV